MGQTTLILMILTVISKIFGFVRESVMAAFIGAGELKSVYTTANTIPLLISNIIAGGIVAGYIPMYNKVKNDMGEDEAKSFTSNLINILMIFALISLALVFVFAKQISKLLSPGLDGQWLDLAANYTRIIMFTVFAFLYASVIKGYLNLKDNFIDPAISGLIINVLIIFTIILFYKFQNPYLLIIGALVSNIIQYVRFPYVAKKLGYEHKRFINFRDPYLKLMLILSVPIILSSAAGEISIIVDNAMGSAFFGKESVAHIYYAKTMLGFVLGVITMTVTTVTYPEIAKLGQKSLISKMKVKVRSAVILALVLVVPAAFGMIVLANPIIELAFQRNAFTSSDTYIVASLMKFYAPYVIFWSITKIVSNSFYSIGSPKIPVIIILLQQFINLVLNIVLINFFDLNGLAFATTISTAIGCLLIIKKFSDTFGKSNDKFYISIMKILIASTLMSTIARLSFSFMIGKFNLTLSLFLSVIISGLIYSLIIYLSNIEEIEKYLVSFFKSRSKK